jgi:hypothetical protein
MFRNSQDFENPSKTYNNQAVVDQCDGNPNGAKNPKLENYS